MGVRLVKWTVHFREDDHKVIYAKFNDTQKGASQNWRSGPLDRQDVISLQEMLTAAYACGMADMKADLREMLGLK